MKTECIKDKVILHIAKPDDLPKIFALVDLYDDGIVISKNKAKNSLREMVYANGVLLAMYNGNTIGGIGGYAIPGMFSEDLIYSVMFFYIRREYRRFTRSVIKEFELSMAPTKATLLVFGIPAVGNPEYVKYHRFFRMMGYNVLETHFQKRIQICQPTSSKL